MSAPRNIWLLILLIGLLHFDCKSQDLKAGEIKIEGVSGANGLTYRTYIKLYYNVETFVYRPHIIVNWGDGTSDTLVTDNQIGNCGNAETVTRNYVVEHTFPTSGYYFVSVMDSFRISGIQNIVDSENESMHIGYLLRINPSLGSNISSAPLNCATDEWYDGWHYYNPGIYDSDGDSLSYSLVVPIVSNYTFPESLEIDSVTGTLSMFPSDVGNYAFTMKIDEWRRFQGSYYIIGTTYNAILIEVKSLTGIDNLENKQTIEAYPNPTTSTTTLTWQGQAKGSYQLELYDVHGKLLLSETLRSAQGSKQLDLSAYAKGIYFGRLVVEDRPFGSAQGKSFKVVKE